MSFRDGAPPACTRAITASFGAEVIAVITSSADISCAKITPVDEAIPSDVPFVSDHDTVVSLNDIATSQWSGSGSSIHPALDREAPVRTVTDGTPGRIR
jgi:hypothetical protein